MNEYMWGVVTGVAATPFVWEGLKWCLRKFKGVLSSS